MHSIAFHVWTIAEVTVAMVKPCKNKPRFAVIIDEAEQLASIYKVDSVLFSTVFVFAILMLYHLL